MTQGFPPGHCAFGLACRRCPPPQHGGRLSVPVPRCSPLRAPIPPHPPRILDSPGAPMFPAARQTPLGSAGPHCASSVLPLPPPTPRRASTSQPHEPAEAARTEHSVDTWRGPRKSRRSRRDVSTERQGPRCDREESVRPPGRRGGRLCRRGHTPPAGLSAGPLAGELAGTPGPHT